MVGSGIHIESFLASAKELQKFIDAEGLIGINYFAFNRFYDNGEVLLLSTNPEVMLNRINQNIPLHSDALPLEFLKANRLFDLTLVNQNAPDIIQQEFKLFGCGHSVIFFHFHQEYYDVFYFSIGGVDDNACKLLINSSTSFFHAAQDFLLMQSRLIHNTELLSLPLAKYAKFRRSYYKSRVQLYLRNHKGSAYISPRESEVIVLYASGYQAKEAARILDISSGTYKIYLHNLGQKLGGVGGKDLIKIARENYLV
ncbi:MAG: helix-turn-helix domain-containing protein [Legionellales bacterium]|jgi:DNA-binding CsgD family transcriptional regulator